MILAIIVLSLALAASVVAVITLLKGADRRGRALTETERELAVSRERISNLTRDNEQLRQQITESSERTKVDEERSRESFKALAMEIMESSSRSLREQHEIQLRQLLNPMKDDFERFRKLFADSYNEEARQRFSLQEHIKALVETNNSIGNEARELARALKGSSKVQGDWGEMVLESILEKSGLQRDVEYTVQMTSDSDGRTLTNDEGRMLRPDIVLHYPNRGDAVIDSKVSLTAYIDYVNSPTDSERAEALRRHVASVRNHIKELRDKRYQDFLGKGGKEVLDFVMMFIPNEGAYMAAMQADNALWQDAFESRVLIVSPTHLVSALRLIRQLWIEERQGRNAMEIAEMAGRMHDKFVGFIEDMEKIKRAIDKTDEAYASALKKLSSGTGNLIGRALKLQEMGVKGSKELKEPTAK